MADNLLLPAIQDILDLRWDMAQMEKSYRDAGLAEEQATVFDLLCRLDAIGNRYDLWRYDRTRTACFVGVPE